MTTNTDQTAPQMDPTQGTQGEQIDWEKRYKDLQSYHDKTKADMVSKEQFDSLQGELSKLQGTAHVNTQKEILGSMHPDYGAVVQSQEFGTWIQGQPTAMQDAIYDANKLDGALAGSALTLFKTQFAAAQGKAAPVQDTTTAAAMAVDGGHRETPDVNPVRTFTYEQIQRMSPDEYAANQEEILKAHREGRIQ